MSQTNFLRSILLVTVIALLVACGKEEASSYGIDTRAAKQLLDVNEQVVVLDVRTRKEFSRGHIQGAVNISIHDPSFAQQVAQLDRDKTYIVHCAVNPRGGRGDKSIHVMNQLGFDKLHSMNGGFNAWRRAGLPVVNNS